ncbi:hypothetical protein [Shewanella surugensis]|uniref:Uncharacterized protein n=1 Tax=Shewanella surugensis TaxID=212020 RepID=A0ABT0L5Y2_9GAMM|nr:hypothetical protein [Shewanella surugensis]MCL1123092.1 hypothetical protein [Shewanella surugensis]
MKCNVLIIIVLFIFSKTSLAEGCQQPKSLNKSQLLFMMNEMYIPSNPNAGGIQQVNFTEKNLTATELRKGITSQGAYQYRIIASGVALVEAQLIEGDDRAIFRMILMCKNNFSGKYIFSQSQGVMKPDRRQNTGDYIIEPAILLLN